MKNRLRFLLELLGPVLIADGLLAAFFSINATSWPDLYDVSVVIATSCFFAIIPSLFYALLMEKAYGRGMLPNSWATVKRSTLLGAGAGACIGFILMVMTGGFELSALAGFMGIFAGLGLVVGLILGLIIKLLPWADLPNVRAGK